MPLCTLPHLLTSNRKVVPRCAGAHSRELWCVSILWLLSSNHFTDFNPLRALVLEGSPQKQTHWQKPIFLPYKNALFVLNVVGDGGLVTYPWLSCYLLCSPGWTLHLFHPCCLGVFRFEGDFLRLKTICVPIQIYLEYPTSFPDKVQY